jgi:hypothetical protein
VKITKQISGHKNKSVFDRYDIINDNDLRDAVQLRSEYEKSLKSPNPVIQVDFNSKRTAI